MQSQVARSAMDRIVVVGTSCAGKSTFATNLSQAINAPVIDLDELHWGPNWTPKPLEQFRALVDGATSASRWVVAGNYAKVRDLTLARATTVFWLNYSFAIVFKRALSRSIPRAFKREELWHGNRESFRMTFMSRNSILLWVITSFGRVRRGYQQLRSDNTFPHLRWIEFKTPREAERFLNSPYFQNFTNTLEMDRSVQSAKQ